MGVPHGRFDVRVSQDLFDLVQIHPVLDKSGGVGMAKGVSRAIWQTCTLECLVKGHVDVLSGATFRIRENVLGMPAGIPSGKYFIDPVRHKQDGFVIDF